jgi:hypothetical protein
MKTMLKTMLLLMLTTCSYLQGPYEPESDADNMSSLAKAVLYNIPSDPTNNKSINIQVTGQDVVAYKYRLDGGIWSSETSVSTLISQSNLSDGSHVVSVVAKNSDGVWQDLSSPTTHFWTIDTIPPSTPFLVSLTTNTLSSPKYITIEMNRSIDTTTGVKEYRILLTNSLGEVAEFSLTVNEAENLSSVYYLNKLFIDSVMLVDWKFDSSSPAEYVFNIYLSATLADTYQIDIYALDRVDNQSSKATISTSL